uniref:Putative secreted protein n=1 Tax=Ixodes scapularis TaxID=6945 RepID=A0A4D5S087_IXOSC
MMGDMMTSILLCVLARIGSCWIDCAPLIIDTEMFGSASLEEAVDTKCTKNIHQKIGRGALCSACDLRELPFLKKKKHWHLRMHACPDNPAICAPSKSQEVLGIFYLFGADQPRDRRWYANGASFYSNGPIAAATGDNTRRKRHLKKSCIPREPKRRIFLSCVCVCVCVRHLIYVHLYK